VAIVVVAGTALAAPAATAAEPAGIWYIGAGGSLSRLKLEDSSIATALSGTGATASATAKDERHFGYKAFLGYQFHRNFAVEGGYFNLGRAGFTSTTTPAGTLHGDVKNNGGFNVDLVGIAPLFEDRFALLARVGVQSSKTSDLFVGTGSAAMLRVPDPSKNGTSYKAGLGAEFYFTRNVGVRGEWERYRVSDGMSGHANADAFTLNLLYKF
jgi:OOP family OmpA-OmpF porin